MGPIWTEGSLSKLRDECRGASSLVLTAKRLWTATATEEADMNDQGLELIRVPDAFELIAEFCRADPTRRVTILSEQIGALRLDRLPTATLMLVRQLVTLVEAGQVEIKLVGEHETSKLPRVAIDPQASSGLFVFVDQQDVALFEALLAGRPRRRLREEASDIAQLLAACINTAQPYEDAITHSVRDMKVTAYPPGAQRRFEADFEAIRNATALKRISIRDPYCLQKNTQDRGGVRDNLPTTALFITKLINLAGVAPGRLEIETSPDPWEAGRRDRGLRERLLREAWPIGTRPQQTVVNERGQGPKRAFHDRWVEVTLNQNGEEWLHRYDISGGVDYYMDPRSEVRITHACQRIRTNTAPAPSGPPVPRQRVVSR
jgi:hypothetical protein